MKIVERVSAASKARWGKEVPKVLAISLLLGSVAGVQAEDRTRENRLAGEQSPYLLQHKGNPVDWFPWGKEAFEKAKAEEKPILLSIGYSTCHWCHVMERESFTDKGVAEFLNEHFVSIKLDREERPDLDAVYMKSFQALHGEGGGWPLNVFLTPDLKLFYGGTYFPPEPRSGRPSFQQVLEGVERAWREEREGVIATSDKLRTEMQKVFNASQGETDLNEASIKGVRSQLAQSLDREEGGWGRGPKFPQPTHLMLMLTSSLESDRELALLTCRKMAAGGIHDRLAGGFHRYAVDEHWLVPHFEKMLYDQAQLLECYLEAWRLTREDGFAEVARGIADYVIREMQHPEGGYYSAQDAQSEGKEGKYWCWTTKELAEFLSPEERVIVERVFGISAKGNFEDFSDPDALKNQNVLSLVGEVGSDQELFAGAVAKMKERRMKRVPPMTDDKILSGWNGLMISAMAQAGRMLGEESYLDSAQKAWGFVNETLWSEGRLANRWRGGHVESSQQGLNYLAMAKAGRVLYQTTFEVAYLTRGIEILERGLEIFFDVERGGFFDGEERPDLVMRLKDDYDSAILTASSLGAQELFLYGEITGSARYTESFEKTLRFFGKSMEAESFSLPGLARVLEWSLEKPARLVLAGEGEERGQWIEGAWRDSGGHVLLLSTEGPVSEFTKSLPAKDGLTAYYCEGMTCREPTQEWEKVSAWLRAEGEETQSDE